MKKLFIVLVFTIFYSVVPVITGVEVLTNLTKGPTDSTIVIFKGNHRFAQNLVLGPKEVSAQIIHAAQRDFIERLINDERVVIIAEGALEGVGERIKRYGLSTDYDGFARVVFEPGKVKAQTIKGDARSLKFLNMLSDAFGTGETGEKSVLSLNEKDMKALLQFVPEDQRPEFLRNLGIERSGKTYTGTCEQMYNLGIRATDYKIAGKINTLIDPEGRFVVVYVGANHEVAGVLKQDFGCDHRTCSVGSPFPLAWSVAIKSMSKGRPPRCLRTCANLSCGKEAPKHCGGCGTQYCSSECQRSDWAAQHRLLCSHVGELKIRIGREIALLDGVPPTDAAAVLAVAAAPAAAAAPPSGFSEEGE